MKRVFLFMLGSVFYAAAIAAIAILTVFGVLDLQIGAVVWTMSGSHGVHIGDIVIAVIAGSLATLFTIGLVLAARRS